MRKAPEIMYVPDTQNKPGVPTEHIAAAGHYANHRKPDIIVIAGDWWDLPSLSMWETVAQKAKEKREYLGSDPDIPGDIEAGNRAMVAFLKAVHGNSRTYRPKIHLTLGNHEHRILRFKEEFPHLGRAISLKDLHTADIKVHPFLEVVTLEGVAFSHFFCGDSNGRVMNTKRGQTSARAQALNVGMSAVAGHKQGLDVAILERHGRRLRGVIAGSYYQHDENYLGPQGNDHWRGCLYLHECRNGDFDLMELSLDYLLRRWA